MDGGFILSPAVRCWFFFLLSLSSSSSASLSRHLSFAAVLTNLISDSLKLLSGKKKTKNSLQSLYTFPRSLSSAGKDKITLSFLFSFSVDWNHQIHTCIHMLLKIFKGWPRSQGSHPFWPFLNYDMILGTLVVCSLYRGSRNVVDSVPVVSQNSMMDVPNFVISIVSLYPHITADCMIVWIVWKHKNNVYR